MDEEEAFYSQVLSRVVRFSEYNSYGRKPRNAAKSIRKKYPSKTLAECEEAFLHVLQVYDEAAAFIETHESDFREMYKTSNGQVIVPEELGQGFSETHQSLPASTTISMLSWLFYWRHLR